VALHTALSDPISTCEYYDERHGHQIYRRVELYVNQASIPKEWKGIQRLIKVRRWGLRNGRPYDERSFYVLSKPINSAHLVAKAIQGHWAIENQLHWIKDVNMGEDRMTIKDANTVAVLVYLNNTAVNILRKAGHKPLKDTFAKFANKVNELNKLLQPFAAD